MIRLYIVIYGVILCSQPLFSQVTFEKTIFNGISTGAHSAVLADSGYYIAGFEQFGSNDYNVILLKSNIQGDVIFKQNFNHYPITAVPTLKKNRFNQLFILALLGNKWNLFHEYNSWFLKVDLAGDTLWTKKINGRILDFDFVPSGGFIFTGIIPVEPVDGLNRNGILLYRTDENTNLVWSDTLLDGNNDWGLSVIANPDTTFTILANLAAPGNVRASILTVDDTGVVLWQKEYPFVQGSYHHKIIPVKNSTDYVFTASTFNMISLVRVTATGDTVWNRTFGGPELDVARDIIQTTDGGFALVGMTENYGNNRLVYLIKTDSMGFPKFERTYGTNAFEQGYSILQTHDNGFFITGGRSFVSYSEIYLIKTDSQGNVWPTGVEENKGVGLQIIGPNPNPASLEFSFGLINPVPFSAYSVELFDLHGRRVYANQSADLGTGQTYTVSTTGLSNTVYLLKISNGDFSATKRIVIIK